MALPRLAPSAATAPAVVVDGPSRSVGDGRDISALAFEPQQEEEEEDNGCRSEIVRKDDSAVDAVDEAAPAGGSRWVRHSYYSPRGRSL